MADNGRLRDEAAAWLARLHAPDGERDRTRFEQWRSSSPAHDDAFRHVERHWEASKAIARSPMILAARLHKPWWHVHIVPVRLALGSMAAAVLVWSAWDLSWSPTPTSSDLVQTAIGELRTISLADGSRVRLDTDSAVSIRFTSDERRVALERGRARFTVAHDPRRRFAVMAGQTLVVARGTVFDVDVRPGRVDVLLVEGSVDVVGATGAPTRRHARLTAGQRVTAVGNSGGLSSTSPLPAEATSWASGMLTYHAATLGHVVDEANRYSRSKLVLAAPALAELRVTGAFRAAAQDELAASIASMFDLQVDARPDGTILLSPTPAAPVAREGG